MFATLQNAMPTQLAESVGVLLVFLTSPNECFHNLRQDSAPFEDHPSWKGGRMRPLLRREPGSKEVLPEFRQEAGWANQLGGADQEIIFSSA